MISVEERIASTRSYLDAAMEICSRTRNELVYELEELLRTSAVIVRLDFSDVTKSPFRHLCWYDESRSIQDSSMPLPCYLLDKEDIEGLSEQVRSMVLGSEASYRQQDHWITLNKPFEVESRFMQGTVLLHETAHALWAIDEGRVYSKPMQTAEEKLAEELRNYEMQMSLWREKNPSAFQSLLDHVVTWVDWEHHFAHSICFYEPGELLTRFPPRSNDLIEPLNQILGPLPVGMSDTQRIAEIRLYAHFELIDRSEFPDKFDRKISVLRIMHEGRSGY